MPSIVSLTTTDIVTSISTSTQVSYHHHQQLIYRQKNIFTRSAVLDLQNNKSLRPEDLNVKQSYTMDDHSPVSKDIPPANTVCVNYNLYPIYQCSELANNNYKEIIAGQKNDLVSMHTNSIESKNTHIQVPRRACMDLNDAITLLDEISAHSKVSPWMTPKTPITPLTPDHRDTITKSKSCDSSSNYSTERLNERFLENTKSHEEKKRSFLEKIRISMMEDRLLLAKLAPKIINKSYLDQIDSSQAVDTSLFDNISSFKNLEKFIFDTPQIRKQQDINMNSKTLINKEKQDPICIEEITREQRRSRKSFLLKMYSFETEDLEENSLLKIPCRDILRSASLDNVVDSQYNSMQHINKSYTIVNSTIETASSSMSELVKCRVSMNDENSSSNSCSLINILSTDNSSNRKGSLYINHENNIHDIETVFMNNISVSDSSKKKLYTSITPKKITAAYKENDKIKYNRQISDDTLNKKKSKKDTDNMTTKKDTTPLFAEIIRNGAGLNVKDKESNRLIVSTPSPKKKMHYTFDSQETFTESYTHFKRKPEGHIHTSNPLKCLIIREKTISPSFENLSKDKTQKVKFETSPKFRSKSVESNRLNYSSKNSLKSSNLTTNTLSMLKKQQGFNYSHYSHEQNKPEPNLNRYRKVIHEPSHEAFDLLSELQRVKRLLKTPSNDKSYETNNTRQLKAFPNKILVKDKEFCLAIERETNAKKPLVTNTLEVTHNNKKEKSKSSEKKIENKTLSPVLFEQRCLSLNYTDKEKFLSQQTEPRTLLLTSSKYPRSENNLDLSKISLINCKSKNYSSDIISTSAYESNEKVNSRISIEKEVKKIEIEMKNSKKKYLNESLSVLQLTQAEKIKQSNDKNNANKGEINNTLWLMEKTETIVPTEENINKPHDKTEQLIKQTNHYLEDDDAIHDPQVDSRNNNQGQSNTNEALKISSPKTIPFKMKKRLGRISVECPIKQERLAINKIDCKQVALQKEDKCFPL